MVSLEVSTGNSGVYWSCWKDGIRYPSYVSPYVCLCDYEKYAPASDQRKTGQFVIIHHLLEWSE